MKVPISVVIPAYNNERFIRRAIESARAQTVEVSEIVVVDNNCTDGTRQIAESLGARVVEEKKQNIAASRNRGIRESRFAWVALLDADDLWKKRKIEYQWAAIRSCPEARMICSDFSFLIHGRSLSLKRKKLRSRWAGIENRVIINRNCSYFPRVTMDFLRRFSVHTSTVVLHREVFSGVGFFDHDLSPQEDVEFYLRVMGSFPVAVVPRSLSYYRQHAHNTTRDRELTNDTIFKIADRLAAAPEKYPAGIAEYYLDRAKTFFLQKAQKLAYEKSRSHPS